MTQVDRKINTQELVVSEFSEFETKMIEFKEQYDNVVYDLNDEDQEKQARSDRFAIGKVISSLDKKHKELKAPIKAQSDLIDGERKRIKDSLLGVQVKIKSQIEEHEKKIREHTEMLQNKVEAIRALVEFEGYTPPTASVIEKRLDEVKAINVNDSYEHRKADATLAQVETIRILEGLLEDRVKYETEQAELEKLRKEAAEREQAEREEQIRKEAVEQARKDAEAEAQRIADETERKRQEEAKAAERAKLEAEQAAQRAIDEERRKREEAEKAAENAAKAERERIEEEQRKIDAEAARIKRAEDTKKAKQTHRAKIHKQAKQSFVNNGFNENDAGRIVTLIKDGLIKNIYINY